ncbi:hypothetical protein [Micromonospora zhanjiangensis]|uniref:Uncharacterized protein n=1 Tax=Micromonospora zhanjiangensis TaxID=1522057 RepID=A0ABV8KXE3_9ACTN
MTDRITVNLVPRGQTALDQACSLTQDTKTEIVDRALVVYDLILDIQEQSGGRLVVLGPDGATERIHLV